MFEAEDDTMVIGKSMVKSIGTVSLVLTLIFSTGTLAFATEATAMADRIQAEETADIVEDFVDANEVSGIVETADEFVDDSGDAIKTIPKDGEDFVTMEDEEGVEIGMSLPEELDTEEGIATDNGTVVYQSDDGADVCVQSIAEEQDGVYIDGMRELVTIKDKDAPKEYTFNFDLPDGYRLITSEEYCNVVNKTIGADEEKMEVEPGHIYVIDSDYEKHLLIDAPWAKDADGTEIKTVYSIDGNSLVQYVGFDENSAFPIVVDPKGKASIKDRYRGLLTTVAAIGESCGYRMAAKLLKHSLQDNPSNLKYDKSSAFSKQIKKSSEYKNTVLPEIKKKLKNVSGSSYKTGYSNSVKLDSTTDLYMALNYIGYKYSAKKSNGKWTVTVIFRDLYDFAPKKYKKGIGIKGNLGVFLNNVGDDAEKVGAIVNYYSYFTIKETI